MLFHTTAVNPQGTACRCQRKNFYRGQKIYCQISFLLPLFHLDKLLSVVSYPMRNKFEIPYSSGELNDYDYRFFIKAQIRNIQIGPGWIKQRVLDWQTHIRLRKLGDNGTIDIFDH